MRLFAPSKKNHWVASGGCWLPAWTPEVLHPEKTAKEEQKKLTSAPENFNFHNFSHVLPRSLEFKFLCPARFFAASAKSQQQQQACVWKRWASSLFIDLDYCVSNCRKKKPARRRIFLNNTSQSKPSTSQQQRRVGLFLLFSLSLPSIHVVIFFRHIAWRGGEHAEWRERLNELWRP